MTDMKLVQNPFASAIERKSSRDGFGRALAELGEKNALAWALSADVSESSRSHWFAEKFPDRFVQVGVAEQNMAGVAAGIASCGKLVFISAFGAFSPGRNFDQIRVSICYNNVNVKIHGSHTGLSVGPDGASHQMLEDISMMRALPNMTVLVPSDLEQAKKATFAAASIQTPAYIRTSRENAPVFTTPGTPFIIGKANVYRDAGEGASGGGAGKHIAIFACGLQVWESLKAAEELKKEGIDAAVVDMHTIKPLDREAVLTYAGKCPVILSAEDHQINGGLGSAVAEVLAEAGSPARLVRLGMRNSFGETGSCAELYRKYGLDAAGIAKAAEEALKLKK